MEVTDLGKAVCSLRQELSIDREAFAERLGVSAKTVKRYEGGQRPTTGVLLAMATLSEQAKLNELAEMFSDARKSNITARARKLASSGTALRIPRRELAFWEAFQKQISNTALIMRDGLRTGVLQPDYAMSSLAEISGMAERVRHQIAAYLTEPLSHELSESGTKYIEGLDPSAETARVRTAAVEMNKKNRRDWDQPQ